MQKVLKVENLPASSLEASATFMAEHFASVREYASKDDVSEIVIVLPNASPDHGDWRRSLALDLAREYAPTRINVVSANDPEATRQTLAYLSNAPGVTGQYLQVHE